MQTVNDASDPIAHTLPKKQARKLTPTFYLTKNKINQEKAK